VSGIEWADLTVPDTERVRDFYAAVAGLRVEPVSMGEYDDYNLTGPDGAPVAGVVHPLGKNEGVPPYWIVYFRVDDLDAAAARCVELGGEVVHRQERTIFVRDPGGAFAGFYQPGREV
jgi:predicted enzyme related to lactoylglutathione lyase